MAEKFCHSLLVVPPVLISDPVTISIIGFLAEHQQKKPKIIIVTTVVRPSSKVLPRLVQFA